MKKLLVLLVTLVTVLSLTSCKDDSTSASQSISSEISESSSSKEVESSVISSESKMLVYRPRFQDITAVESEIFPGAIKLIVSSLDSENTISYIVCEHPSNVPSNKQIVDGVDYGSSMVADSGNSTGSLVKTVLELDENTDYDVYITLSQNGVYPNESFSTTVHTHTQDEVVDKGQGTQESPFLVQTLEDLENVAMNSTLASSYYLLDNDIDMSSKYGADKLSWNPIGYQSGALIKFTGNFNGNGHTISNLYLKSAEGDVRECQGLFAQADPGSYISNLTLTNVHVEASSQRVGALIGYSKATISNISILGGLVSAPARKVGGAIGDVYDKGIVKNVYTDVDVVGKENVGGVIGGIDVGSGTLAPVEISSCMAVGSVTGSSKYIGGIVGYARGFTMSQCVSMADITGPQCLGGLIGYAQNRSGNTIIPDISKSYVLGSMITITSPESTKYSSGYIIGNPSTSNLGLKLSDLYYCAVVMTDFAKMSSSEFMKPVELSKLSDIDFLNDTLAFRIGYDTTYILKDGAVRPTLVVAGDYDDGSFNAPLMVTSLELTESTDITALNILAGKSSDNGSLYYIIKESSETMPTAAEIITANNVLSETTISGLTKNTEYTVYVLELLGTDMSDIVSATCTTGTDELIASVTGEATLNEGELKLAVTANKEFKVYAVTSLTDEVMTKTDIVKEENLLNTDLIISNLNGGSTIYVNVVVASLDGVLTSEIVKLDITVSGTPYVPFNGDTELSDSYFPIYCGKDLILLSDIANGINTDYSYSTSATIELKANCELDFNTEFNSIGPKFKGTLEGNGFTISNMYLNSDSAFLGFFQQIDKGGMVQNIVFDNANIVSTSTETGSSSGIGVVAGYSKGSAQNVVVMNSSVDCSLGAQRISAFIGRVYDGEEVMTYERISVIDCTVVGTKYAGLAFGHMDSKTVGAISVTNLYVSGTITGTEDAGAIGYCRVSVSNLVADITVNCPKNDGVIGYAQNNAETALTCILTNIISLNETDVIGSASTSKGTIVSDKINLLTLNANPGDYATTYVLTDLTEAYLTSLGFDTTIWALNEGILTIIYSFGGTL